MPLTLRVMKIVSVCMLAVLIVFSGTSEAWGAVPGTNGLTGGAMDMPPAVVASGRTVTASVVALDQRIVYNRLGAEIPKGMIYALRHDVVNSVTGKTEAEGGILAPGQVELRADKRPRPLTLRLNAGDILQINFQNLLSSAAFPGQPATRSAGINVMGMQLVNSIGDDGSNVGVNPSSIVPPGGSITYALHAQREGTYLLQNTADAAGGLLASWNFGLFGAVNVEPAGSEWYRSQVTQAEMALASTGTTASGHPIIDYDAVYPEGHRYAGLPILNILAGNEIVHSDLTAIITGPGRGPFPAGQYPPNPAYPNREEPFRELTQVFHDENEVLQAFPIFEDPAFGETLHSVRDSFAINYGTGGIGAMVVANRLGVGPMWDAVDMKYEESFLSSWVGGDPAMIVDIPANTVDAGGQLVTGPKATVALYPDDPSNVYHSYMNDHLKIRNVSIGKEHHIFHLHTEQWLLTPDDDNSNYLDMQGVGPGSGYTYEIAYGGSGNRNKTFGDAIFHCHFYPHFAQGMWALWRMHDVFEGGTVLDAGGRPSAGSRALPDGEIEAGTPIPAVVPLPGKPMAPIPGETTIVPGSTFDPPLPGGQISITEPDDDGDGKPDRNVGFPLFMPAVAGHRPPTAPLDLIDDGGLPRHIVIDGTINKSIDPLSFAADFTSVVAKFLPEEGTPAELAAMDFHAQRFHDTFTPDGAAVSGPAGWETNGLPPVPGAPFAEPARTDDARPLAANREYRGAHIQHDTVLNKEGWHFPQSRTTALWADVDPILTGAKAPEPFVMRTNAHDVIDFYHTNLTPMRYIQDDFQVLTETDVTGQHMHLVKFDVLASDGAANGYNYEDGTLSPDEVRERIRVIREPTGGAIDLPDGMTIDSLEAKPHPFFGATGPNGENWLGARTTVQRWYVDPLANNEGVERIMGNAFTHDHLSPSTVQQTGLYGSLVMEPQGSQWRHPETGDLHGGHAVAPRPVSQNDFSGTDGGPTSWRADIITSEDRGDGATNNIDKESYREFYFEFGDFQLAYLEGRGGTAANPGPDPGGAVNPPPVPEAVSADDPGTYSINYRNEPLGLRILDRATGLQALGDAGDISLALSSNITRANPRFNVQPTVYPPLTADVRPGDPFTPMPRAYVNDNVKVRIQVGATEEGHNFNIHGLKWLQEYASPNSGWRNSQMMGISEQFILDTVIPPNPDQTGEADYVYSASSATDGYWNGDWGIIRSYAAERGDLVPLPSNPIGPEGLTINNAADFIGLAPADAPVRTFDITAVTASTALPGGTLVYNPRTANGGPLHDPTAIMYVRTEDLDSQGKLKPGVPVEPLILRAAAGERIVVTLRNRLPVDLPASGGTNIFPPVIPGFNAANVRPSSQAGLHPQLVAYGVSGSDGMAAGVNPLQSVRPGETVQYQWYAGDVSLVDGNLEATPIEFGATNLASSDKLKHSNKGAVGALIIEPQGSTWVEDSDSRASATVTKADGTTFRDFVLLFQDDVDLKFSNGAPVIGNSGEEDAEDSGNKAVNYRTEPAWFRLGVSGAAVPEVVAGFDFSNVLSNTATGGDPSTPLFTAEAGEAVRFRVLLPGGHTRNDVFVLSGHVWQREPYVNGSTEIGDNLSSQWIGSQEGHGPTNHFDIVPQNGAGGAFQVEGDYLYRDGAPFDFFGGIWGIFRVTPVAGPGGALKLVSPRNGSLLTTPTPTLSWQAFSSTLPVRYELQVTALSDRSFVTPIVQVAGLDTTSFTVSLGALSGGGVHQWRVRAVDSTGVSAWSTPFTFRAQAGPPAPALVSPANMATIDNLTPQLAWGAVAGAVSYRVQISTASGFLPNTIVFDQGGIALTTLSLPPPTLTAATTYFWRVQGATPGGVSAFSPAFRFQTPSGPRPPALTSPSNGARLADLLPFLDWSDVAGAGAVTYTVQVSRSPRFDILLVNEHGLAASLLDFSVPIPGHGLPGPLEGNSTYYWRVSATDEFGTSAFSRLSRFQTPSGPGMPPLPVSSMMTPTLTPTLEWREQRPEAASFDIQIATDARFTNIILGQTAIAASPFPGATGFDVPAGVLNPSAVYFWRVRSTNEFGASRWRLAVLRTPSGPRVPPILLPFPRMQAPSTIPELQWRILRDEATSFTVQVATSPLFTEGSMVFQESGIPAPPFVGSSTVASFALPVELQPGTRYYWRASGANEFGGSRWSGLSWFMTPAG